MVRVARLRSRIGMTVWGLLVMAPMIALSRPASAQIKYTVSALPSSPGSMWPVPSGFGPGGWIYGNQLQNGVLVASVWDGSAVRNPGALPGFDYSTFSRGNNTGLIAGTSYLRSRWDRSRAFVYDGSLFEIPFGPGQTAAYQITDFGVVVGAAAPTGAPMHAHIFDALGAHDIDDLVSLGGTTSFATGISGMGTIVGYADLPPDKVPPPYNFAWHAFRLHNGILSEMIHPGDWRSYPADVNNAGEVIGCSTLDGAHCRGFLFDASGLHTLDDLSGFSFSTPNRIDDNGTIYGAASAPRGVLHAAIWLRGSPPHDLNEDIDPLSGWELWEAQNIDGDGRIIGAGIFQGDPRGFVLTPIP